jgi:hypothetical protein
MQVGAKLTASDESGAGHFGSAVSLSGDAGTALIGGAADNADNGAAWVFTHNAGAWSQDGGKLAGTGNAGPADQGAAVSLSADGNTALIGGPGDNGNTGAAWVFSHSGGLWSQQGSKVVSYDAAGAANLGQSVGLSDYGSTAIVGGPGDNNGAGAAWLFSQSGGVWSEQGSKQVGSGALGNAFQGYAAALSADGTTAMVGGPGDNGGFGAAWVFEGNGAIAADALTTTAPASDCDVIHQSLNGHQLYSCGQATH